MSEKSPFKILVVEDDKNLGFVISDLLEMKGFDVNWSKDGIAGLKEFGLNEPHLCIIDIMMPKKDGFTLIQEIKEINSKVPVIFLTARSMEEDRVRGFELGADDYVTKPFSNAEFILRVEAVLKRCYEQAEVHGNDEIIIGKYEFHPRESMLFFEGTSKKLTQRECEILQMLTKQLNTTIKRETILNVVWGNDDYFSGRSLDVFIAKLRKYLSNDPIVLIENIHGVGFRLAIK